MSAADVVLAAAAAVLAIAALVVIVRMTIGPTMLDRAVSFDVVVSITIAAVAVDAAVRRTAESLPLLLVATLLGFVGSISIARFSPGSDDVEAAEDDPDPEVEEAGHGRHETTTTEVEEGRQARHETPRPDGAPR